MGAQLDHYDAISTNVVKAYITKTQPREMFGVGFVVILLRLTGRDDDLHLLKTKIETWLGDSQIDYEDRLYLAQALLLSEDPTSLSQKLVDVAFQTVSTSRVWSYLMVGVEELSPVGSEDAPISVSDVYRSSLLDVMTRLQHQAAKQAETAMIESFRGRRIVGLTSFGFSAVFITAIWWALLWFLLIPYASPAHQYWLQNSYGVMSRWLAVLYFMGITFSSLLLPWSLVFIWTTWKLLAVFNIESDRYIFDVIKRRSWYVLIGWCTLLAIGLGVSLFSGAITNAFIHTIGGK